MSSPAVFSFIKNIATSDGDTTLVAAPGTGKTLRLQGMLVCITTAAAQAFDIEDSGGSPVEVFKAPASLAVGNYLVDAGGLGVALTTNTALEFDTASAGVGATISGYGWIQVD